jgi:hypothetical protein
MEEDTYFIHDNGGRPFQVKLKQVPADIDALAVSLQPFLEPFFYPQLLRIILMYATSMEWIVDVINQCIENTQILHFRATTVFVGESPENDMTRFSGAYGPEFKGNSILVKEQNDTLDYVFIGEEIFRFRALASVASFVSPVGNNDVPYPYALDIDGRVYLMIADAVMEKCESSDPYAHYYDHGLLTTDRGYVPPRQPKHPYFRGIDTYYIGNQCCTMTFDPNPGEFYDRQLEEMSIVTIDRKRRALSREDYVSLMQDFGKMLGFERLQRRITLQRRL